MIEAEKIVARGKLLYEERLRHQLETGNTGKILVINVDTGDYEMDRNRLAASDRAAERFSGAPLYAMWIGALALGQIGLYRKATATG